ncbi:NAD(P)HX epimerase / NAD(P)HX dehydratase [Roseibacterium elongatum DSM 19469]|uniref:Bifunctional NAD(P)H-hydrate repair enzyme n=1 Tax=Roseicyclus elongatus DSM 19469 TaxID=1294273 RepID=W8S9N7_9RHOB|nr:NAD(P)H-hydrate dehydratase [Roseibacterium elongatum]AHM05721.1 NAD(P)HX epimerase / NAD(P)HX dehydratase [Roseibacterium elongatum DSM 19469]
MELLTAAQMRDFEQAEMAAGRANGLELMERAGQGVVQAILSRWPDLAEGERRAVIWCGPGNNGGDGYVIARLLADRGWDVAVRALGDPRRLPPDAAENHRRWCARGPVAPLAAGPVAEGAPDLFVDALFGTGLTRPLDGALAQAFAEMQRHRAARDGALCAVAVDIPSGLCSDSGRRMGNALDYDLTVTFHSAKPGHYLAEGPSACGGVAVVDIGLPGPSPEHPSGDVARLVTGPGAVGKRAGHKYDHGHAVILAGPMGRTGAGRLAARAALRVGAGLVTVAAPGSALLECAAQLTAIMVRRCDDADGLAALLHDARLNALCLGPGLGLGPGTRDLVGIALRDAARGVVLDADALTAFAEDPDALFARLHGRAVLTPHDGEFARLFPDLAAPLRGAPDSGPAWSRIDAARAAAARAGAVLLLKGPDTVIAAPDGRVAVHAAAYERAAPWLATAGAGDVLAGLVAGLLARGLTPDRAAQSAAWLHVEAARAFGPGLIAEDLPEVLPRVLAAP